MKQDDEARRYIAKYQECLRENFKLFLVRSFLHLRPGEQYFDGWHVDAICHHLQAVKDGQIKRLIINMPPRSLKSITTSIAFPAWLIGNVPSTNIICASYAQSLSNQHSLDCRAIMESDWFRAAFPTCRMAKDQNEKSKYKTTLNGMRFATSVGGTLTGLGGSCFPAGTMVSTDRGEIPIEELFTNYKDIKVKSFNHLLEKVEYKPIIASKKSIVKGLYEILTAQGISLKCTGDHPIYIEGRGYTQANRIEPGQQVYYSERLCIFNVEKTSAQENSNPIRVRMYDMWSRIQNSTWETSSKSEASRRNEELLLKRLRRYGEGEERYKSMPDLQERVYQEKKKSSLLQRFVRKAIPSFDYAWRKTSNVYFWSVLSEIFQEIAATYKGERQFCLSGLQIEEKINCASYRQQYPQQYISKSNSDVRFVPYNASQTRNNSISSVTRISDSEHEVYDIQIEDNHNFFANGILVHNCIIIDDPINPQQSNSDVERETANNWISSTVPSRLNNQENDAIILNMQRLHENDPTGFLLDKKGWEHLCLPAKNDRRTIIQINGFKKIFEDQELLHPDRLSQQVLTSLEKDMGSFDYAGQYLQAPVPKAGGILKSTWWKEWESKALPACEYILQVYDTAYKLEEMNDYSARTTWGIFRHNNGQPNIILLEAMNKRLSLPDLKAEAIESYQDFDPDLVLIEDKSSGISLIQELRRLGIRLRAMPRGKGDDKVSRAHIASVMLEQGVVWYPKDKAWAGEVIRQCASFPNAKHDDLTDTVTDALIFLRNYKGIEITNDRIASPGSTTFKPSYGGYYG